MIFSVISIPKEDEPKAKAVAKISGMRIADGIPTLIGPKGPKSWTTSGEFLKRHESKVERKG